jgi:site-specific DNA-cytosine methylase
VSIGQALGLTVRDAERRAGNRQREQREQREPARTVGGKGNAMVRWSADPLSHPAPAVTGSDHKGSGPSANPHKKQRASDALYLGTGRRRLTVAECARLQGFPDGHPFQGTKAEQYKQVGNACCPAVVEAIASAIPSPPVSKMETTEE